jgi:hypothetical protein
MPKVILYCEGEGEDAEVRRLGSDALQGRWEFARLNRLEDEPIPHDELGAGHILIARSLRHTRQIPEASTSFYQGKKLATGRFPRGSDLLLERNIQQLGTVDTARPHVLVPDLFVFLVDQDDDVGRKLRLQAACARAAPRGLSRCVVVAVKEFEAWLVADTATLRQHLRDAQPLGQTPESLERRVAKEWLQRAITEDASAKEADRHAHTLAIRRALATNADLSIVERTCPSFSTFIAELRNIQLA